MPVVLNSLAHWIMHFVMAVYHLELKMEMPTIKSSMEGFEWVGQCKQFNLM